MAKLFLVCTPGLEQFTLQELREEGFAENRGDGDIVTDTGGIELSGSLRDLMWLNLHLRTVNRILLRVGEFHASRLPELRRKAARLPWKQYLSPRQPLACRASCHKSKLYHSGAVAERIVAAIGDTLGGESRLVKYDENEAESAAQLLVVRLLQDRCTISIDASGAALFRRGYRQAGAKAPLRETLAAVMLLAAKWDGASPLIDPFCGSGTIPVEAALLAGNMAPGLRRDFAFMNWPVFEKPAWDTLTAQAESRVRPVTARIIASDRDAGAIATAQENARRAGVSAGIDFSCRAVSAIDPPAGTGWVISNLPYGKRIGGGDLRNLYARFGRVLQEKCPGWQLALLGRGAREIGQLRQTFSRRIPFNNGGLAVELLLGLKQ